MRGVSPLITVFYPSFINGVNTLKKIWPGKIQKVGKSFEIVIQKFLQNFQILRTL
jgi:hypothetical protein